MLGMAETIKSIQEFSETPSWYDGRDGFRVETTDQVIELAISNYQDCCESWGYLLTEDDTSKFIGAEFLGLALTDINRLTKEVEDLAYIEEGDVMFVDINTSEGVLQFVAYNAHNGYYGHRVFIQSRDLTHEDTL